MTTERDTVARARNGARLGGARGCGSAQDSAEEEAQRGAARNGEEEHGGVWRVGEYELGLGGCGSERRKKRTRKKRSGRNGYMRAQIRFQRTDRTQWSSDRTRWSIVRSESSKLLERPDVSG
jgi:hypothetical protein